MSPILDVDLVSFERGDAAARRAVVAGVMRSLATGFVYLEHDLAPGLIDGAYEMLASFFHLDRAQKERYSVPASKGQSGYTGMLVETAAGAASADWKEMLNWGPVVAKDHPLRRRFPHRYLDPVFPEADVPGISRVLTEFHDTITSLQKRFLRIIAVGLGAHPDYFESMIALGPTLTRAIRYPPMDDAPADDHVWAGAHGDINLITALPRATARGLQVEVDDEWVDAVPPAGCAIINTGLMLEHVTNGVIPAGIHRVVADPNQRGERLSVVQFCHPTPWTILSPLPTCIDDAHPPRYPAVTAGDWLDSVLHDINLG